MVLRKDDLYDCIYSEYHYLELNRERVHVSVDGCKLHLDNHHQWLAKNLEYCKDFHCYKVDKDKKGEL